MNERFGREFSASVREPIGREEFSRRKMKSEKAEKESEGKRDAAGTARGRRRW